MTIIKPTGNPYEYDVFIDKGWDNWLRVRKYTWGIKSLNGVRVDPEFGKQLSQMIAQHPRGVHGY